MQGSLISIEFLQFNSDNNIYASLDTLGNEKKKHSGSVFVLTKSYAPLPLTLLEVSIQGLIPGGPGGPGRPGSPLRKNTDKIIKSTSLG